MYRVVKDAGAAENIYLQNTSTMAEINLGIITPAIAKILKKDGYIFDSTSSPVEITLKDKWNLEISNDVKTELARLAMPMKKPIRNKAIETEQEEDKKEIVDVLDIIYGIS